METAALPPRFDIARCTVTAGGLATAALVIFGTLTTPHFFAAGPGSWAGLGAAGGMALAYGAAGFFGLEPTRRYRPPAWVMRLGMAAGAIYAVEIALEYVVRPTDNASWGSVEYGLVLSLVAVSGGVAAWRTGRIWPGALAGGWTAAVAALIWYPVLLTVFYVFRGTAVQEAILRAEGDIEDFRRSGFTDFKVFIMQDFLGAGFFHMLLSPLVGLLLGTIVAIPAAFARRRLA